MRRIDEGLQTAWMIRRMQRHIRSLEGERVKILLDNNDAQEYLVVKALPHFALLRYVSKGVPRWRECFRYFDLIGRVQDGETS